MQCSIFKTPSQKQPPKNSPHTRIKDLQPTCKSSVIPQEKQDLQTKEVTQYSRIPRAHTAVKKIAAQKKGVRRLHPSFHKETPSSAHFSLQTHRLWFHKCNSQCDCRFDTVNLTLGGSIQSCHTTTTHHHHVPDQMLPRARNQSCRAQTAKSKHSEETSVRNLSTAMVSSMCALNVRLRSRERYQICHQKNIKYLST